MARRKLTIGVRDFALPIPRTGSIETHSGYNTPNNSGQDVHNKARAKRRRQYPDYVAEVKLAHFFSTENYDFNVTGFVDGLYESEDHLEEIKTAFDTNALKDKLAALPDHPYILQLQTYGYIYYMKHGRIPKMQLSLVSTRNAEQLNIPIELDLHLYTKWLHLRLRELEVEAGMREAIKAKRKKISAELNFPFSSVRPGQQELMDAIDANLKRGKNAIVQAATGLGKTIGVSYPLLKNALARGERLVYVTPKNSQHTVAEEAISCLQKQQPDLTLLTMTAKSKMCLKSEMLCNPAHCEFAKDYYAKVYEHKLIDMVSTEKSLNSSTFKAIGKQYQVCPFELSVDALDRADVVIADYNYVFSPRSLIGKLTSTQFGSTKKPNLVIDEAHNLPARANSYFSHSMSMTFLNSILWNLPTNERALILGAELIVKESMKIINRHRPGKRERSSRVKIDKELFQTQLITISDLLNRYLENLLELRYNDPVVSLFNEWSTFTEALEYEGEEFHWIFQDDSTGGALKIICCDASHKLEETYKSFEQTAAFSATLKPFEYYAQMLGMSGHSGDFIEFPGPFPKHQRKILIIPQVSTKYSDRSSNYKKIAEAAEKLIAMQRGNYIVFFPSYAFLDAVYDLMNLPTAKVLKQEKDLDKSTIDSFMQEFKTPGQQTVLFAVQGGVFAEGVDYPGDMLIGALIVGPPLPTFDLEREVYREYYEKRYGNGFHYAYIYPAMSKVVQAAGRVIRSESDSGLIVLMDKRFVLPEYVESMPKDWFNHSIKELISCQIGKDVTEFWSRVKSPDLSAK
ncbi:MAG TPA: ATP-dependent DNA helicase [Oculatellaceae cyanobacterium]